MRPVAVSLGGERHVHREHGVDQRPSGLHEFLVGHVFDRSRKRFEERVDSLLDVRRGVKRALDHHSKPANLVQNLERGAGDVSQLLLRSQLVETLLGHELLREKTDRAQFVRGWTVLVVAVHDVGALLGVLRGNREPRVARGNDGAPPGGKIIGLHLTAAKGAPDHGPHRQRLVRGDVSHDEALDVRRRGPDPVHKLPKRRGRDLLQRSHLHEFAVLPVLHQLVQQAPSLAAGLQAVVLKVLQSLFLDLLEPRVRHLEVRDRLEVRLDQVGKLIAESVKRQRQHGVLTHHVQPRVEARQLRGIPNRVL